jgi:hypothetical protein
VSNPSRPLNRLDWLVFNFYIIRTISPIELLLHHRHLHRISICPHHHCTSIRRPFAPEIMSSITTAIPTGAVSNGPSWCIQGLVDIFASREPPYTYNECANATTGTKKADFQTFCCDGDIIDTSQNLWGARNYTSYELDLENLVCCRAGGQLLPGGLMPIDTDYTHCSASMKPEPLASLAATNTDNAALYLVTYESASQDATGGLGDWTVTEKPTCLWIETADSAVTMVDVTVPAAQITTLPPPTTDQFGYTIVPSTTSASGKGDDRSGTSNVRPTSSGMITNAPSASVSSAAAASTTSAAGISAKLDVITLFTSIGLCLSVLVPWMI